MDHEKISHHQIETLLNRAGEMLHDISMLQCETIITIMKCLQTDTVDCAIKVPFYSTSGFTSIAVKQIRYERERSLLYVETADQCLIPFCDLMPLIQNLIINTIYVSCYIDLTD